MHRLLLVLFCLLTSLSLSAKALSPSEVPEPLKPWVDWVLFDSIERKCPFIYSNDKQRHCAWPSRLSLELNKSKGQFSQQWSVYQDSWITLPGGTKYWPQSVKVNDKVALVVRHRSKPAIRLKPGRYRVKGELLWDKLPESLSIPANTGLVSLKINKRKVAFAELSDSGQLWLRESETDKRAIGESDKLEMQVFRRINDDLPVRLITRIQLDISGSQREVLLGRALLDDYLPLILTSRLPARLEPDGRLRVQVRPGRWVIELEARHPRDTTSFLLSPSPQPWPRQEVWAFSARNHLRLVEVIGNSLDPRQTGLPKQWQNLPAYLMKPNDILRLNVLRRGNPEPEPDQLNLDRDMWLDFAGKGYTLNDRISGRMTRGWRLETLEKLQLGRVDIDGQPQFITRLADSGRTGVEVRRGKINMSADSRYNSGIRHLPATGWAQDFQQVSTRLHLPPGWTIFTATGIDNVPQTWVNRWTLLDLFMVLVLSVAVMRLWNVAWGLLALFSFALVWHEFLAPQWIWVHLLLAIALLRVIHSGKFHTVLVWYRNAAILSLALILVPFAIHQVKLGLYPQLERPWQVVSKTAETDQPGMFNMFDGGAPADRHVAAPPAMERAPSAKKQKGPTLSSFLPSSSSQYNQAQNLSQIDPRANVQTGPGLPDWTWTTVQLDWNGPVLKDQQVNLILVPPGVNSVIRFLRVLLMLTIAALMLGVSYNKGKGFNARNPFAKSALLLLLAFSLFSLTPNETLAANKSHNLPDAELLKELKARLLASPECLPHCAQAARMRLDISPKQLKVRMEIHAQQHVAIPIPSHNQHWLPNQVLVDGKAATSLYRKPGHGLWLGLKKGRYQIQLSGPLPARTDFSLPLPLKPQHVSVTAKGWTVEGVHEDGKADSQLQLTRIQESDEPQKLSALQPGLLPAFVRVERTLRLGLDWYVETRVVRASPVGTAILLEVPLLRGESPVSAGIHTSQHKVLVNMSPSQSTFAWRSVLGKQVNITLHAPDTTDWVEVWRVDVSPVWHLQAEGLPVVHHQDAQDNWLPEWRPWPGEKLSLDITRPQGIDGKTFTIDQSQLHMTPGQRASEYILSVQLRSSQGGQHRIQLPDNITLQSVMIDGRSQPIQQEGDSLTLPIVPGPQTINITWRTDRGIHGFYRSEKVNLGSESTNASSRINLGEDRWILFTQGPSIGPAVLYWGLLIVLALVAFILGRFKTTPLNSWHWFLLAIGLSQVSLFMAAFIVIWLMTLAARSKMEKLPNAGIFNAMQIGLGLFTLLAVGFLFIAVQQGLLGQPEMHISGNRSSAYALNWYQDRSENVLPRSFVVSVPLHVYRLLMLAWALWLAFSLLKWLRWGWQCLNVHALWLNIERRTKPATRKQTPALPEKDIEDNGKSGYS